MNWVSQSRCGLRWTAPSIGPPTTRNPAFFSRTPDLHGKREPAERSRVIANHRPSTNHLIYLCRLLLRAERAEAEAVWLRSELAKHESWRQQR